MAAGSGGGNADPAFKPAPDECDDTDPQYFYFGWLDIAGGWLVRRQNRSDQSFMDAATGFADLATAWANRATLGYS